MRLVVDIQGAQGENAKRGIGRYSLALAEGLIRTARDHDVVLALNDRLAEGDPGLYDRLAALLPPENIKVWTPPAGIAAIHEGNGFLRRSAEALREGFIAGLDPRCVHVSSLFEGLSADAATSIGRSGSGFPSVVTLYDLIPLLHPDLYLKPNPLVERWYLNKLDHLRRASVCLAISQSSRREAIERIGMPEDRVLAIGAAADARFRPVEVPADVAAGLRRRLGLHQPFVLYTGGIDPRKNIEGLIRAYALLPPAIRGAHQLAVVCSISDGDRDRLCRLAGESGLPPGALVLTGFVSDEDLVHLYALCRLFAFPSWHEGFGLPPLEAMSCGAPVIAADSSSLPEVIGRPEALFAARDDRAMAVKLHQTLTDEPFREALRRDGLEQAKKFSWDATARRAWDGLVMAGEECRDTRQDRVAVSRGGRPRLAYVSPLPPARTGIADYSAKLLPELARHYDIDLVANQTEVSDPWIEANCPVRDAAWFEENAGRYDRILYHFGNSDFHHHMFGLLERHPGLVVLHDFNISGLVAHMELHYGAAHLWSRTLYESHGYGALAERFANGDAAAQLFEYPCNLEVMRQARGVIVHSAYARRLAHDWCGPDLAAGLAEVPLLCGVPAEVSRAAARRALGLPEDAFIVCSFGHLGRIKSNDRLLAAWLASVPGRIVGGRLVFVGENEAHAYGQAMDQAIAASGAAHRVAVTGFVDAETYRLYLAAADIAVQLRSNSKGETSAAVLDCLNYGLATIVNAHGAMADLPDETIRKIPDAFTDADLTRALDDLFGDPDGRRALGSRAAQRIRRDHAPRKIADLYAGAIEACYAAPSGEDIAVAAFGAEEGPAPGDPAWDELAEAVAATFPPLSPVRQLLVDVSELVRHDAGSGIQRVVRNILTEWLNDPPAGYRIEPVYAGERRGYRYARQFTLGLLGCPPGLLPDDPVEFAKGDVFLGLDLQPHVVPAQRAAYARMRRRGVTVLFVVYDLLCIERPDCFVPDAAKTFTRWLEVISENDGALCISAAVADSLRRWRGEKGAPFRIGHFHLGADFPVDAGAPSLPAAWSSRAAKPTLLMVGSIEPRKGHAETLAAAEKLWAGGADFTLAIVGRTGWMVEDLVARLRRHPEMNRRLFWFDGCDDATLAALYREADGMLLASEAEGFGLPLVEAAHYGLPILVRDLPVFREVAGDHARYFSADLAGALSGWIAELAQGIAPSSSGIPRLTWRDSARQLAQRALSTVGLG